MNGDLSKSMALIRRANSKAKQVKDEAVRKTKNSILSSLPGVAKLKLPDAPAPPHLLTSNDPPNDSDKRPIRKAIFEAIYEKDRLETLLENGDGGSAWRMGMGHNIERTNRFISDWISTLEPIRRLPDDVLLEIFALVVLINNRESDRERRSAMDNTWSISQVCRSWRVCAVSTPSFWCFLSVSGIEKKQRSKEQNQIARIKELICRSGDVLLDIHIQCPNPEHVISTTLINKLVRCSERWKSFTISSTATILQKFRGIENRLQSLSMLALNLVESEVMTSREKEFKMFEDAPQLRTARITGSPIRSFIEGALPLPLGSLVHLVDLTGAMACQSIFGLLGQTYVFHHLQSLTFRESCMMKGPFVVGQVLEFPRLTRLDFRSPYTSDPLENHGFLQYCYFPVLETLRVDAHHGNLLQLLSSAIIRSKNPPIKSMHIRNNPKIDRGHLAALLRSTPTLVSLNISLPSVADISSLTSIGNSLPLVPRLKTCTFHIDGFVEDPHTATVIQDMASSRCEMETNHFIVPGEICATTIVRIQCDDGTGNDQSLDQAQSKGDAIAIALVPILRQASFERWDRPRFAMPSHRLNVYLRGGINGRLMFSSLSGHLDARMPSQQAILSEIEANVKNAKEIFISNLHVTLALLRDYYILNGVENETSEQINRILEKWKLWFKKELRNFHWIFELTSSSIRYIGDNDGNVKYTREFSPSNEFVSG